jgi:hypothetical protein
MDNKSRKKKRPIGMTTSDSEEDGPNREELSE